VCLQARLARLFGAAGPCVFFFCLRDLSFGWAGVLMLRVLGPSFGNAFSVFFPGLRLSPAGVFLSRQGCPLPRPDHLFRRSLPAVAIAFPRSDQNTFLRFVFVNRALSGLFFFGFQISPLVFAAEVEWYFVCQAPPFFFCGTFFFDGG